MTKRTNTADQENFIAHLDYLFSLCRQTLSKRKDWQHLISTLKKAGWKKPYRLSPSKKRVLKKNLEGNRNKHQGDGSLYDE